MAPRGGGLKRGGLNALPQEERPHIRGLKEEDGRKKVKAVKILASAWRYKEGRPAMGGL